MNIATIKVDPQNAFTELCPMELPVVGALEIIDELNAQDMFADVTIISQDEHPEGAVWEASEENPIGSPVFGYKDVDLHWNRHAVRGTFGAEVIKGLPSSKEHDLSVKKGMELNCHPYGALWHNLSKTRSTGIIEFLTQRKIDFVIVGGLALDFCVRETVIELLESGFTPVLNLSATRAVFPENKDTVVDELRELGAIICSSHLEVLDAISAHEAHNKALHGLGGILCSNYKEALKPFVSSKVFSDE